MGPLKNAIDWASRPPGQGPLQGKPAVVVGLAGEKIAAAGRLTDERARAAIRPLLVSRGG